VFVQAENALSFPGPCGPERTAEKTLALGGLVRRGGPDPEAFDPAQQEARTKLGIQLLQTDHPWHVFDDRGPWQPLRVLPTAQFPAGTKLIEQGAKLLFESRSRGPQSRVFAYKPAGDGDWVALVSVTRPPTDPAHPNAGHARGVGCLRAQAASTRPDDNRADHIAVCRLTEDGGVITGPGENVRISVELSKRGIWMGGHVFDGGDNVSNGYGELLRLEVKGSCATVYSAAEAPGGVPAWRQLRQECFDGPLTLQGFTADTGDVLFVGPTHDGKAVRKGSLAPHVLLGTFGQTLQPYPADQAYRLVDETPMLSAPARSPR
jgi:hypothetical protein